MLVTRRDLALPYFRANPRERLLFLAHLFDRVHFAQRQFEVQAKQRLFQTIRLRMQIFIRHVAILIYFFTFLHSSLRFAFQVSSFKFQVGINLNLKP